MLKINDRVDVYRNLRSGNFSIRKNGIVHCRADGIVLDDVTFHVSQKGRQRVLDSKQKNVHAVVRGTYKGSDIEIDDVMNGAYYNPYTEESFVDVDSRQPLIKASKVYLKDNKIFYCQ